MGQETKSGSGATGSMSDEPGGAGQAFLGLPGADVMTGWMRAQEELFKGVAEIGQEALKFTQSQMGAGVEGWTRMAQCKSTIDLFACQQKTIESMSSNYFEHVQKLGDRVVGLVSQSASEFGAAGNGDGKKRGSH